jgi:hypothetical protein
MRRNKVGKAVERALWWYRGEKNPEVREVREVRGVRRSERSERSEKE